MWVSSAGLSRRRWGGEGVAAGAVWCSAAVDGGFEGDRFDAPSALFDSAVAADGGGNREIGTGHVSIR